MKMKKLEGKMAVVTGGSRGIGAAIAKELGREGATVVINYNHSHELAQAVVEEIKAMGSSAIALQADISKAEPTKAFIEEVLEKFSRIDILVNNAGITRDRSFKKMSFEEWHKVIDTNLSSAFNTCKIALPAMLEQKYGRIINISSVIGQAGGFGQTNYAAAKAGLIGFTKSLALETARAGITVNAICPGYIATEMVGEMPENVLEAIIAQIPMKKLGAPADVAKGVIFICESDYMTGQCLNLNGGLYML
jgi:acetoacetyl-CoA reductase